MAKMAKAGVPRSMAVPIREDDDDETILMEARERAAEARAYWDEVYAAADADAAFYDGHQWSDEDLALRSRERQPTLTLNTLPAKVDQVIGDMQRSTPSIMVEAGDDASSGKEVEGSKGDRYDMAEVYEGIIRQIERASNAMDHYDRAALDAVIGGIGWLRVYTEYCADEGFDQDIRIKSVLERETVLLDPNATEPDMSDAEYGFVFSWLPRKRFLRLYPDAAEGALSDRVEGWGRKDMAAVAEYFTREPIRRRQMMLSTGEVVWHDEVESVLDELAEGGVTVIRDRKVQTWQVQWRKITSHSILEGPLALPCSTVPLVPMFGKSVRHTGRLHHRGVGAYAQDPIRAQNFWMSEITARVAAASKAPWLVSTGMIAGLEDQWARANEGNPAVLIYNSTPEGVPARIAPAAMPAAELTIVREMGEMVKSVTGMYDAAIGARSNETSGVAIRARAQEADTANIAYVKARERAIRRIGRIVAEMIPRIYDSPRVIRIRRENGTGDWVKINQTVVDKDAQKRGGEPKFVMVADVSAVKVDIDVQSGPGYSTQREEAVAALLEMIRVAPQMAPLCLDIIARNMNFPGAKELGERIRKTLPPGLVPRDSSEEQEPPPPPSPEQQVEAAKAQAAMATAEASIAKAEADKIAAAAAIQQSTAAGDAEMQAMVRQMVAEAIADVIAQNQQQNGAPA